MSTRRRIQRVRFWKQIVAWRLANLPMLYGTMDYYAPELVDGILGEDDYGELYAQMADPELWEPFTPFKLRHIRAAMKSRRLRQINFMEFE